MMFSVFVLVLIGEPLFLALVISLYFCISDQIDARRQKRDEQEEKGRALASSLRRLKSHCLDCRRYFRRHRGNLNGYVLDELQWRTEAIKGEADWLSGLCGRLKDGGK